MKITPFWLSILLLVDSIILIMRPLYEGLVRLAHGWPWIPMFIGLTSLAAALFVLVRMRDEKA